MRVIVTGASGFLGKHVLASLRSANIEVCALSRQMRPGLTQVLSYLDAPEGDAMIHLAESSDRGWVNMQDETYETITLNLLEGLITKRYPTFIYASSATLYGDTKSWPRRVDEPITAVDRYARIKASSESIVLESGGLVVRLSNLYGPGQSAQNVVSTILAQLGSEGPLIVQNVHPTRDFLWAGDAAKAMTAMTQRGGSGVFNVGTAQGTSIQQLAESALTLAGEANRTILSRVTDARPSTLTVDISQTIDKFRWQPAVSLADGLAQLIASRNHG